MPALVTHLSRAAISAATVLLGLAIIEIGCAPADLQFLAPPIVLSMAWKRIQRCKAAGRALQPAQHDSIVCASTRRRGRCEREGANSADEPLPGKRRWPSKPSRYAAG